MKKSIAIIGGGTAALYLLRSFVDKANANLTLDIFESAKTVGMGMPYNSEWSNLEHKVNIASKELPKALEEPHHWLLRQSDAFLKAYGLTRNEISPDLVFPRILFGKYHESQFFSLLEKAQRRNLLVSIHTECKIVDIEDHYEKNKTKVVSSNGSEFEFDLVIIATGHEWPKERENKVSGYYDSPFPLSKLHKTFNHPVGILGSSLSAVDAVRTLALSHGKFKMINGKLQYLSNRGTKNFKIVMHSRRGLLPSIRYHLEHPRIRKYEYISQLEILENIQQNSGYLSLDYVFEKSYKDTIRRKDPQTFRLIKSMRVEEFSEFYYRWAGINSKRPFDHFVKLLKVSKKSEKYKRPIYWREAIEDTYYTLNFHAKSLCAEDMIRLRKYLMPMYYHAVIFMPFDSAHELIALYEAEKLEIIPTGYHTGISTSKNGAILQYKTQEGKVIKLTYVTFIDCRGQKELSFKNFPFKKLAQKGSVISAKVRFSSNKEHFLQLPGIAFNDYFQVIDREDKPNPRIYVLANAYIKGFNPDLSGIPFCKDAAEVIMSSIMRT